MKKMLLLVCILLCLSLSAFAAEKTYTGTVDPITVNTAGEHTIILNGVTIEATDSAAITLRSPATKVTIILKNGTTNTLYGALYVGRYQSSEGRPGIANNGVSLVIRCENAGEGHVCDNNCGKLNVAGGNSCAAIGGGDNQGLSGSVTIHGGNITADNFLNPDSTYYNSDCAAIGGGYDGDFSGSLTITGGNIVAKGTRNGAGIGGGNYGDMTGTITITGGKVTASAGAGAAGIGGGSGSSTATSMYRGGNMSGTIKITGGTVVANGGFGGPGIGSGGYYGDYTGKIIIEGGSVTATGGDMAAGIGGGAYDCDFTGSILIKGGTVIAKGGTYEDEYVSGAGLGDGGAGIGNGMVGAMSKSASIVIEGGTVTAIGGDRAAGIGGNSFSFHYNTEITDAADFNGKVEIKGGTVTAVGGNYAAGIGGGERAAVVGSIIISGGTVNATGGNDAAGIGGGYRGEVTGSVTVTGGVVEATGNNGGDAIGIGNEGTMTEDASIVIDPAEGKLEDKAGADAGSAEHIEGSPFADKADVTERMKGLAYARIAPYIPAATPIPATPVPATPVPSPAPVPEVPQTGDGMNFAALAILFAVGLLGMTVIIRRKREV